MCLTYDLLSGFCINISKKVIQEISGRKCMSPNTAPSYTIHKRYGYHRINKILPYSNKTKRPLLRHSNDHLNLALSCGHLLLHFNQQPLLNHYSFQNHSNHHLISCLSIQWPIYSLLLIALLLLILVHRIHYLRILARFSQDTFPSIDRRTTVITHVRDRCPFR